MTGMTVLTGGKAVALWLSQKPPGLNETLWEIIKKRGFVDLYVLQPADPDKPNDPNRLEAKRPDVIVVDDVDDFLRVVRQACAGGKLLRHLRIGSHGNATAFHIGNTWISVNELKCKPVLFRKILTLKDYLLPGFSHITIDACRTGSGKQLLIYMATLWGVPVLSYLEAQSTEPLDQPTRGEGPARHCHPGGLCYTAESDDGHFVLDTEPMWITKPRPGCQ